MRTLIEHHFGLVFLAACVVGLIVPGMEKIPDSSSMLALTLLTYISCFKLREGSFSDIHWPHILLYYVIRFALLPVALFALAHQFAPEQAMGVFLLALVPSAVSSPAFSSMFGGLVAPAFAIVILSQLLAPLMIPLQFAWLGDLAVAPSPLDLFRTLMMCIFAPMIFYYFTRKQPQIECFCIRNNKLASILLVTFVIALVIAKQRDLILADPIALIAPFVVILGCYALFMIFGWWFSPKTSRELRTTYLVCSGFNNVALGVSLALLHFPPQVVLLVAVSEVAWSLLPMMMRWFLMRV